MCQQKISQLYCNKNNLPNKSEVVAYLIVIIFCWVLKEYFGGGNNNSNRLVLNFGVFPSIYFFSLTVPLFLSWCTLTFKLQLRYILNNNIYIYNLWNN